MASTALNLKKFLLYTIAYMDSCIVSQLSLLWCTHAVLVIITLMMLGFRLSLKVSNTVLWKNSSEPVAS